MIQTVREIKEVVNTSNLETSVEPYQKKREMTRKLWTEKWRKLLVQREVLKKLIQTVRVCIALPPTPSNTLHVALSCQ